MTINSRRKGARGELEACEYLSQLLGGEWARTGSQQRRGGHVCADIESDDWPDVWVEVKRGKRNLSLWAALEQAKRDSRGSGRIPVVLARRDRQQWVLFAEAEDLVRLWSRLGALKLPVCSNCLKDAAHLHPPQGLCADCIRF